MHDALYKEKTSRLDSFKVFPQTNSPPINSRNSLIHHLGVNDISESSLAFFVLCSFRECKLEESRKSYTA